MSAAARQKIEAVFTFEKIVRDVERIYSSDSQPHTLEVKTETVEAVNPAGP